MQSHIAIDSQYAGGNIKVIAIEGNKIKLEQEIRDTAEWWFYWNFAVKTRQSEELLFEFMNGEVLGPWGPEISKDGMNWSWLGADSLISRTSFKYLSGQEESQVYFSFSLPYLSHHFDHFYSRVADHPLVKREILVYSGSSVQLNGNHALFELASSIASHAVKSLDRDGMLVGHGEAIWYDAVDGVGYLLLSLIYLETKDEEIPSLF